MDGISDLANQPGMTARPKPFTRTLKLILESLLDTTKLLSYKVDGTPNVTTLILRFSPKKIVRKNSDSDQIKYNNTTSAAASISKFIY